MPDLERAERTAPGWSSCNPRASCDAIDASPRSIFESMMASALDLREDDEAGRWIVETALEPRRWEVIVEPDHDAQLLVVVTAYPLEST